MAEATPQFVQDWEADRKPLLDAISNARTRRRAEMDEVSAHQKALSHAMRGFEMWIGRLEGPNPQPERCAREMRKVLAKVRSLLGG